MVQVIETQRAPSIGQALASGFAQGIQPALAQYFEKQKNTKTNKQLFDIDSDADPKVVLQKLKMMQEYGANSLLNNSLSDLYGPQESTSTQQGIQSPTNIQEPTSPTPITTPKATRPKKDFAEEGQKLEQWFTKNNNKPGLGSKQKAQLLEHYKIKKQQLEHEEEMAFKKEAQEKRYEQDKRKFTKDFVKDTYKDAQNAQLGLSDIEDMAKIREKGNLGPWKGGKTAGAVGAMGGPIGLLATQIWNRKAPQGFEIMSQEEAEDRANYDAFQQKRMAELRESVFPRMTNIDTILANEKYLPDSNLPDYVNRAREKNVEKLYKTAVAKQQIFEKLKEQYGGDIPEDVQQQVESQLLKQLKSDLDQTKPEYKVNDVVEHLPQPNEVPKGAIFRDSKGNRIQSDGTKWITLEAK